MNPIPHWWKKPRKIAIVVDNPSWILPYVERFTSELRAAGESAKIVREHVQISDGSIAFFLGCIKIAPPDVLARNHRNLVVHGSDLPRGRGFSPLTWQILEGLNTIPVCLLEADVEADAGAVIYRDAVEFTGHELIEEMRASLGEMSIVLCQKFLAELVPPAGEKQQGQPTFYRRRKPEDSRLDPQKTLIENFNLFRVVDNEKYPAWFSHLGRRYKLTIEKMEG